MYIVKWASPTEYSLPFYTGGKENRPWTKNIKDAKFFPSHQAATDEILRVCSYWLDNKEAVIEFIHPLNCR